MGASAIHVRCMDELTEHAVRELEQIHSSWIDYEVAGEDHSLMALCADDIELWPPDAAPLIGRAAFSAQMAHRTTSIHSIDISSRRIRGSNEIAYRKLQDHVFIARRSHSQTNPRKSSLDTAKGSRYMGCSSCELVIVESRRLGWNEETPQNIFVP